MVPVAQTKPWRIVGRQFCRGILSTLRPPGWNALLKVSKFYKTSAKPRFMWRKNRPPTMNVPAAQAATIPNSAKDGGR
jgi:hypothetical protein